MRDGLVWEAAGFEERDQACSVVYVLAASALDGDRESAAVTDGRCRRVTGSSWADVRRQAEQLNLPTAAIAGWAPGSAD